MNKPHSFRRRMEIAKRKKLREALDFFDKLYAEELHVSETSFEDSVNISRIYETAFRTGWNRCLETIFCITKTDSSFALVVLPDWFQ